jgi:nicotinamidase-related amidase
MSDVLLTPESSLVMLVDYQEHVMKGIASHDHALIELNGQALARASKAFNVPAILTTIGVEMQGDEPTLPSIRDELPDSSEIDRSSMNTWEDAKIREAVAKTGRRRIIFAGLWTEVCLLYPVLHAQREGFETYFVVDAVGGSSTIAHDTAIARMIQAGSQPVTLNALLTEWIQDWGNTPHAPAFMEQMEWYGPKIAAVRDRLQKTPFKANAF